MSNAKNSFERQGTAKELDEETGLYYYGTRYLDPRYSMWISTDPALGEYIPKAPINEEAKRYNQNLPGMGGIFNHINSNLYHYAGNNPIKYIDPDGRITINSRCDFFMNGRSTVLGIQPNRGPNALPSPDGSSPAKELTIGSYGCVVTFFARLASTISGLKITPEIINQYCIDNNLFDVDTSDDYKDQTLLSVENGCKAINGLLEKNNIKNIKIEVAEIFAITDDKSLIDKLNMYDADKMNYYMFGIRIDDKHTVNLICCAICQV